MLLRILISLDQFWYYLFTTLTATLESINSSVLSSVGAKGGRRLSRDRVGPSEVHDDCAT